MALETVFLAILSLTSLILFCYYYSKNVRKYWRCFEKYPGPPAVPFVGNVFSYQPIEDILPILSGYLQKYGPVVHMWAGFVIPLQCALFVADVKLVEFVLSSQKILDKAPSYDFLKNWLSTGLLTAGGKKWRHRRRILTPTFHMKILEGFVDVFNKEGDVLIRKLRKEIGRNVTDVYPLVTLYALDVICDTFAYEYLSDYIFNLQESTMGTSIDAQSKSESKYVHSVKEMCRIIIERTFSLAKFFDFTYQFTEDSMKERKAIKILNDYTDSVIRARRGELKRAKENPSGDEHEKEDEGKKRLAFLDLLLQAEGETLSDEDVREEVATFMFAGHDTTASAIAFTLYCLANNPDIQQKALEEQKAIYGKDKERPVTYKEMQEMKYLEMVIKESLRMYPSVPSYARCLDEDLFYDGIILPKGLQLYIMGYTIHRNPELYPEPEKFVPERFTPENCSERSPYAYIPFSVGPRNCIGQKFALLEMKATLSKILRNFELKSAGLEHDIVLMAQTVLKSKNGMRINLRERVYV